MNDLQYPPQLKSEETIGQVRSSTAVSKFDLSELWKEFLLDLLMATVLSLFVYRYSGSAGWAIITGFLVLLAGMLKQGLKHLIRRAKPHYDKAPVWVRLFLKTSPLGLLALVGCVYLFGPAIGLFSAAVFMVGLTTAIWLNQSDIPRF